MNGNNNQEMTSKYDKYLASGKIDGKRPKKGHSVYLFDENGKVINSSDKSNVYFFTSKLNLSNARKAFDRFKNGTKKPRTDLNPKRADYQKSREFVRKYNCANNGVDNLRNPLAIALQSLSEIEALKQMS